ncbi:MAG: hypothetical protein RL095_179 [Verrucomicrobiota bacterium]|jgi:hydroxymethylpyrimidine/phosphomethylpyrimidine kinase
MPDSEDYAPVCLAAGGSDSGGEAGLQADLLSFRHFGVHGCCAVSAATAQNPLQVREVNPLSSRAFASQIAAVASHFRLAAVKSGMLASAANLDALLRELPAGAPLVADPVLISTSGRALLSPAGQSRLPRLFRRAALITPNLPEAEFLLGRSLAGLAEQCRAAAELAERHGCAVLLKGGHGDGDDALDILRDRQRTWLLRLPRLRQAPASHGTGCRLAAAATAIRARQQSPDWLEACRGAKAYVHLCLAQPIRSEAGWLVGSPVPGSPLPAVAVEALAP